MSVSPTPCCYRTALDPEAAHCGDCGQPLLRCMAFEDCGGLVGTDGLCPVCIKPVLELDPDAVKEARIGSVLTLPFRLTNAAGTGRPIFLTGLWVRTGEEPRREAERLWERLDAGASSPIPVRTAPLEQSGVHRIEVAMALETRFRWRSEVFLFAASMSVTVEGDQASTVHQTINLTADTIEPGATVYAPVRPGAAAQSTDPGKLMEVQLLHAERLEMEMGFRGSDTAWRLPRAARFRWRAFAEGEAPADGPLTSPDGLLTLGRSRTRAQEGPGDVRLLVRKGDQIDSDLSTMISRRHCHLFIQNDRLMIRADSDAGLVVDGKTLSRGESVPLAAGSRVACLPRYPEALGLKIDLDIHHGVANDVTITRLGLGGASP